ncbi:PLP-dependent aminotransferase family protein [Sporolactobacillus pectinivorans]|uniref:MocR-like pyridoxine biosynthesis transcription factor PdxR n=1 Tax=Sporolactobacillus pectinivorans TaxID=1591408 RepID=UPI000C259F5B|nr:PLP-dependent aminotransferase family protein [Sporolactobacillus pectinivorans]
MKTVVPALNREDSQPLYVQLFTYFINEIKENRLPYGCKLPSKRKLSSFLKVSLNTIDSAYQQLLAEGYVESRPRSGMFVIYKDEHLNSHRQEESGISKKHVISNDEKSEFIDFSHGKVDTDHFPYPLLRKYSRQLYSKEGSRFFQNGPFQGSPSLRHEIATYLYQSRGVICDPSQVVIGSGTQYLLGQLLQILPQNMTFAMENPGFHRVRELVHYLGIPRADIPVEFDGLAIDPICKMNTGIVYLTPSHQFPLGMILPVSKRIELVKWANEKENRYVIEDDYDGEFRYAGKPVPSLQGLDQGRSVIYLGTFSKSLIPSLRVSYMILPDTLVDHYLKTFSLLKQTASSLNQQIIYLFMKNGDWEHHIDRMRTLYKHKHQMIIQAIQQYLDEKVLVIGEKSGLHLILQLNNGMGEGALIQSALSVGVKVYPTSIYYASMMKLEQPQILLGFAGLNDSDIQNGIRRLSLVWNK